MQSKSQFFAMPVQFQKASSAHVAVNGFLIGFSPNPAENRARKIAQVDDI